MAVALNFKNWLIDLFSTQLAETEFDFGKHRGLHHHDPKVPTGYLIWLLNNVSDRFVSPEFRQEIEAEISSRSRKKRQTPPSAQQPSPKAPVAAPRAPTLPSAAAKTTRSWVKAKVVAANAYGLVPGKEAALSKRPDGSWDFVTLDKNMTKGVIPGPEVAKVVQSIKDSVTGQPEQAKDPRDFLPPGYDDADDANKQLAQPQPNIANKHIMSNEMMSEEQRAIDAKFEQIAKGDKQNHVVIGALAGTGKTTALKHLAWKYGNPSQKWLYLVFNTKNKVEAKEKFPPWVQVATTNGFLGGKDVLGSPKNKARIKPTDRIVDINKHHGDDEGGGGAKIEKARILIEGPEFSQIMQQLGLPPKEAADSYQDPGAGRYGYNRSSGDATKRTLGSLLKSIRYQFKEQVLTLLGLGKSFAIDPRDEGNLEKKLFEVFNKYDFDTELSDVKDRILKYDGAFGEIVRSGLNDILGYDFLAKDYRQELLQGTVWMMNRTMPHGTGQKYRRDNIDYNLGQFRDFNDDLWFAAIHAEEITWPHYNFVLADEVQDFNEAQKIVLKKLHDAGAKIVAVGDENQSIYRFRGADTDAFSNIAKQLGDLSSDKETWRPHTLTKNFRSRKAILDFANSNTHVNNLQQGKHFKDGGEGEATYGDIKYNEAFDKLRQEKQAGKVKQTAFISRTNEPLVEAALNLLADGIPFIIVGKDIARDLMRHIDKIVAMTRLGDYSSVDDLAEKLQGHLTGEEEQHGGSSARKGYLQELTATTKALVNSIEMFQGPQEARDYRRESKPKTIADFKQWLKQHLGGLDVAENERDLKAYKEKLERENPVILTTAHKSKGLEFERVYILRYDQFPHPKAKRAEDLRQEENAKYVALTRAMSELHILALKGQPGMDQG